MQRKADRNTERRNYVQFLAGAAQFGFGVCKLHCYVLSFFFGEYGGLRCQVTGAVYEDWELLRLQVISLLSHLQDQLPQINKYSAKISFMQELIVIFSLHNTKSPLYKANKIQCSVCQRKWTCLPPSSRHALQQVCGGERPWYETVCPGPRVAAPPAPATACPEHSPGCGSPTWAKDYVIPQDSNFFITAQLKWKNFSKRANHFSLTSWIWETMAVWVSMSSSLIFSMISSLRSHFRKRNTGVLRHMRFC